MRQYSYRKCNILSAAENAYGTFTANTGTAAVFLLVRGPLRAAAIFPTTAFRRAFGCATFFFAGFVTT